MKERRARWGDGDGGQGEGDFRRDVDAIRDDIARLKEDLVRAMRHASKLAPGSSGRDILQNAIQEKLDRLNAATSDLGDWGSEAWRTVQRRAARNPAQTALGVIGIGIVLGAIALAMNKERRY